MASFRSLPFEVLAQIFFPLCSRTITRLWLTGDAILCHHFTQGVVRSWRVFSSSYDSVVPYPRHLPPFSRALGDFQVYTRHCPTLLPRGSPEMTPQSLTSLVLISPNVFQFLSQCFPDPSLKTGSSLRVTLPTLLRLDLEGIGLKEWPISDFPPILTDLRLCDAYAAIMAVKTLYQVPETLVRCKIRVRTIIDKAKSDFKFPASLKTLSLHSLVSPYNWFLRLPRDLQYLSIGISSKYHDSWDWSSLPPKLEHLKLRDSSAPSFSYLDETAISQLPRTLLTLKLPYAVRSNPSRAATTDFPDEVLQRPYPPNLRYSSNPISLDLLPSSITSVNRGFDPDLLSKFPYLTSFSCSNPTVDFMLLPPTLTSLTVVTLGSQLIRVLPTGLKILSASYHTLTAEDMIFIPPVLTSLRIDSFDPLLISHLPTSITDLHVQVAESPSLTLGHEGAHWKNLENLSSLRIDSFLTDSLVLQDITFFLKSFSQLQSLHLEHPNHPSFFDNMVWPQQLISLHLSRITSLIRLDPLKSLPKNLRSLSLILSDQFYPDWHPQEYFNFPRRLRSLSICGECHYEEGIAIHLPSTLTELSFNNRSVQLAPKAPAAQWSCVPSIH